MSASAATFLKIPACGPSRWLDLVEAIGGYEITEDTSPWELRMISSETIERFNLFVKNAAGKN